MSTELGPQSQLPSLARAPEWRPVSAGFSQRTENSAGSRRAAPGDSGPQPQHKLPGRFGRTHRRCHHVPRGITVTNREAMPITLPRSSNWTVNVCDAEFSNSGF